MKERMIKFLLENANPSIKKRIKNEVLHNLRSEEAIHYQEQIMQEPIVQQVINCQNENGWIGAKLHGDITTQEGGTKFLAEKALNKDTPVLKRAMDAFLNIPLDDWCYDTRGRIIDEFKVAGHGHNLIRCACIARAEYDDVIDISPQIQLSLDSFKRVLEVDSALDISRPIQRGKRRVFNDNEKWPCRYHLDILAHTTSWKSKENIRIIADSITKMMKTDRPELFNLNPAVWVGYPLGRLGGFPSQGLTIKATSLLPSPMSIPNSNKPEVYLLEYLEWFARCGIIQYIPSLQDAVNDILDSVDNDGICRAPVLEGENWGPYFGMKLEVDWKSKIRKNCDITFRALLILHYIDTIL
jgi:hypothetical protein